MQRRKPRRESKFSLFCFTSHRYLSVEKRLGSLVSLGEVHSTQNGQLLCERGSQDGGEGVGEGVVWEGAQQTLDREREREKHYVSVENQAS